MVMDRRLVVLGTMLLVMGATIAVLRRNRPTQRPLNTARFNRAAPALSSQEAQAAPLEAPLGVRGAPTAAAVFKQSADDFKPAHQHAILGRLESQYDQEAFMYERYQTKIPHSFVEFGCRDGIKDSNTYVLEKAGWEGLCIEAIEAIKQPQRKRASHGAICDPAKENSTVVFDRSLPGLHGMKGSTNFSMFHKLAMDTRDVQVKCLSLPRLLDNYHMSHVGYMTVDLEGGEPAFIQHFDFARYRIDILQVECNTKELCNTTRDAVESKGFRLVFKHRFSFPPTGGGDLVFENLQFRP